MRTDSATLEEGRTSEETLALTIAVAGLLQSRSAAPPPASYSVIIRGGTIYDGSGGAPYVGDVALKGDKIVYVGPHAPGRAARDDRRDRARPSRPASSTC